MTRVVYAGASMLALLAAWLFQTPPSPDDSMAAWPALVIGAVALAIAAIWPGLLSGRMIWIVVAALSILGSGAGLFNRRLDVCCQFVVVEGYGYPFSWLKRRAVYETLPGNVPPATFGSDATWVVDQFALMLTLAFWTCLGIAAAVLVSSAVKIVRSASRRPTRKNQQIDLVQH